ncbi:MAG: urease accessory protein UreF [Alphaproteobacteria bacterium]|nr:urease accessory protein UreF [Alphaproteobacteria bacterium]
MTINLAGMVMTTSPEQLLRLQSWLSPAFPIGAFSYSHGLEFAVEAGLVHDRKSLVDWLEADLRHGSGRNEAIFLACALAADDEAFAEIAELAAASFGTRELALEGLSQGEAFLTTVLKVWPNKALRQRAALLQVQPTLAIAMAMACSAHGIDGHIAQHLFLQAWCANLVNAAVRLVPLGQTDGQLAQAALEGAIIDTARETGAASLEDLGSAALMVDWASTHHESQYTRLFRS